MYQATSLSTDPAPNYDWPGTNGTLKPWTTPVTGEFTNAQAVDAKLITADEALAFEPQEVGVANNGLGVGRNGQSQAADAFKNDADAVVRLGPIIVSFRRLGFAIHDPRVKRHHLRVLFRYMERLNQGTGTAFPSRRTTAEEAGVQVEVVENALYDLRKWGYITWEKRAEPTLHKGRLLHYTLPVLRWTEEQLTQAIRELRSKLAAEEYTTGLVHNGACTQPDVPKSTRPVVTRMYGPAVRRKKFRRSGFRSCINVSGL